MITHKHLDHGGGHQTPDRIIIHSMGEFIDNRKAKIQEDRKVYHAPDWLDFLKLSAHALITPEGDIIRCRKDDEIAWHARGFNTGSLGIEFLVPGTHDYGTFLKRIEEDWTTNEQMDAGLDLVRSWQSLHNITKIDRHSDVSPGRKVDPGSGFPYELFER